MANFIDLTGQKFGKLICLKRENKKWLCICDCGNKKYVGYCELTRQQTRSCGCLRSCENNKKVIKLKGQKFNKWTIIDAVIERSKSNELQARVKCDCGKIETRIISHVIKGRTKKCKNCMRDYSLINKRFGKIVVLKFYGVDEKHRGYYSCICDCGNKINCSSVNLKQNHIKSCGCNKLETLDIINKRNIIYLKCKNCSCKFITNNKNTIYCCRKCGLQYTYQKRKLRIKENL